MPKKNALKISPVCR